MRLSPPHMLRGFALTLGVGLLLITAPPLQAQTTPTPQPQGAIASAIEQSSIVLQQQGAIVVFAILFVVLVILFAWVAIKPTITNNTASNNALIQSTQQNSVLIQDYQRMNSQHIEVDRSIQQVISENTHTLILLNKSSETTLGRMTTEREAGVAEVNKHTDEVIARLVVQVNGMVEKVDHALELVDTRLRGIDGTVKIVLRELQKDLHSTKDELQSAKDASSHNIPLPPPAADPAQAAPTAGESVP